MATLIGLTAVGQTKQNVMRAGNEAYEAGKFEEAERLYQEVANVKASKFQGEFNRADALYRQEKYEDAAKTFGNLAEDVEDRNQKSWAYHNQGNAYLQSQKYDESIASFKSALRANPYNEAARYNLAYAQKMKKKEEEKKENEDKENKDEDKQDEDKQDKKDQENKDNKDKDKEGDDKDKKEEEEKKKEEKKDKEKEKNEGKDEKEQKEEPKPMQISPEDAARLLESLQNDEKKTQAKVNKLKAKGPKIAIEKDW